MLKTRSLKKIREHSSLLLLFVEEPINSHLKQYMAEAGAEAKMRDTGGA